MKLQTKRIMSLILVASFLASVMFLTAPSRGEPTWSSPVNVATGVYGGAGLYVGPTAEYVLTWEYPAGYVELYRSTDSGMTWSLHGVAFQYGIWGAWPGVSAFNDGTNDIFIVAAGGMMSKSTDGGSTFTELAPLPGFGSWTCMAVGTNASWFGATPDDDIYVWGVLDGSIAFTKSTDAGTTWSNPVHICGTVGGSYWPSAVSDGSRIYLTYVTNPSSSESDLHIRSSSDWGSTWSEDKLLLDAAQGERFVGWQMQYLGQDVAILTIMHRFERSLYDIISSEAEYGILDLAGLTYTRVGSFLNPDYIVGHGIGCHLADDGRFSMVFMDDFNPNGQANPTYIYTWNSGLVTPKDPLEILQSLIDTISSWDSSGPSKETRGLLAKLYQAKDLVESGRNDVAVHVLDSFVDMVRGLSGKKLTTDQASMVTTMAADVIEMLKA